MKRAASIAVAVLASVLTTTALAQSFSKPQDAIKYRQGAMNVLGAHFSALGAMASGRAPFDAQAAARHADVISMVSTLPWSGFAPGTEKGADTRAQPDIWLDQDKFKQASDRMQGEVRKLAAAAKTGDLEKLKQAFRPAAASCKACHDDFRRD